MGDKKKGKYKFKFGVNPDTIALLYISVCYRVDLVSLLLLYEKFGRDVFYFFFILSGKTITFPRALRFLKVLEFSQTVSGDIKKGKSLDGYMNSSQFKETFALVKQLYREGERSGVEGDTNKSGCFEYEMDVVNGEDGQVDIRVDGES